MVRTMRDLSFLVVTLSAGAAVLTVGCSSSNNPSGTGGSVSSVGGAQGGTTGSGGTSLSGQGGTTVVGSGGVGAGGTTTGSGGMNGLGGTMMGVGGLMMGSGGAAAMGGMTTGSGGIGATGGMMGGGGMMMGSGGALASGGAMGTGGMMMGAGGMMMGSGGSLASGGAMGTGGTTGTGASCQQAGTLTVTNSGMTAYVIDGMSNPSFTFCRGMTYTFAVNTPGHPFYIKTVQSTGTDNAYSSSVTGNGATSGNVVFVVPADAPATLFYDCSIHAAMTGTIHIVN